MAQDFASPRPNLIVAPKFSVEILGRTGIRYIEGEKAMLVGSEALALVGHIAVYSGSITGWARPHESEPFGPENRARIISNIQEALQFKGYVLEVV
jgi:hypothetical protein